VFRDADCIGQRSGREHGGTGLLKRLDNVECNERLILDDED
jgi:hypothetical protein